MLAITSLFLLLFSKLPFLLGQSQSLLPKIGLRKLNTSERVFVELTSGRQVIFHGLNAVVKGFPYVPTTNSWDLDLSLSVQDHELLQDLGINLYRLGSMWKGAEPIKLQYNMTYINLLKEIVVTASKFDIYTLFDMHQDLLSQYFCGAGVPDFAVARNSQLKPSQYFPSPVDDPFTEMASDGYPTRQDCNRNSWPSYYNTHESGYAFDQLYTNSSILGSWANFWRKLAEETGNENALLGYELINEPWAGDVLSEPRLIIPSVADKLRLQPAYDEIAKVIRSVDEETLIFFAGVTWDDIVPSGFSHAPGGNDFSSKSVFAFHYYKAPQLDTETYFYQRASDARRLETGLMLTEFYIPGNSNDDIPDSEDYFEHVANACDFHRVSWTAWEYKTFCRESLQTKSGTSQQGEFGSCIYGDGSSQIFLWKADGTVNDATARKFARTYAQKTQGTIISMRFDIDTGDFELVWSVDTDIKLPTEIFAHQRYHYPLGMTVATFPPEKITWKMAGTNIISVTATRLASNGDILRLSISKIGFPSINPTVIPTLNPVAPITVFPSISPSKSNSPTVTGDNIYNFQIRETINNIDKQDYNSFIGLYEATIKQSILIVISEDDSNLISPSTITSFGSMPLTETSLSITYTILTNSNIVSYSNLMRLTDSSFTTASLNSAAESSGCLGLYTAVISDDVDLTDMSSAKTLQTFTSNDSSNKAIVISLVVVVVVFAIIVFSYVCYVFLRRKNLKKDTKQLEYPLLHS